MHRWNRSRGFALAAAAVTTVAWGAHADQDGQLPPENAGVERAQFTTQIDDREPVDRVVLLDSARSQVFFFTELRNMEGRTVVHRWEYQGEVMAEVPFQVGGPRWRVYSSKSLGPGLYGKWTVLVVDQSGLPLRAGVFRYLDRDEEAAGQVPNAE